MTRNYDILLPCAHISVAKGHEKSQPETSWLGVMSNVFLFAQPHRSGKLSSVQCHAISVEHPEDGSPACVTAGFPDVIDGIVLMIHIDDVALTVAFGVYNSVIRLP